MLFALFMEFIYICRFGYQTSMHMPHPDCAARLLQSFSRKQSIWLIIYKDCGGKFLQENILFIYLLIGLNPEGYILHGFCVQWP